MDSAQHSVDGTPPAHSIFRAKGRVVAVRRD